MLSLRLCTNETDNNSARLITGDYNVPCRRLQLPGAVYISNVAYSMYGVLTDGLKLTNAHIRFKHHSNEPVKIIVKAIQRTDDAYKCVSSGVSL